jgi:hypothetical protein
MSSVTSPSVRIVRALTVATLALAAAWPAAGQGPDRALVAWRGNVPAREAAENVRQVVEALGLAVDVVRPVVEVPPLEPYACVFDLRFFIPPPEADRHAYLMHLRRGRGLLLLGEWPECCRDRIRSIQDFLRDDAQAGPVAVEPQSLNCGSPGCQADYVQDTDPAHPLTSSPNPVREVTWSGYGVGFFADVGNGTPLTPGTTRFPPPAPAGPQIVAAAWDEGDLAQAPGGRVVAALDSDWLDDRTCPLTDNRALLENIAAFLCAVPPHRVTMTPADGFRLECPAAPALAGTVEADPAAPVEVVSVDRWLNGGPFLPPGVVDPPLPALTPLAYRQDPLPLPLGGNVLLARAVDARGASAWAAAAGQVVDTLPPAFDPASCADLTLPLDASCRADHAALPVASDACDQDLDLASQPPLPVAFAAPGSVDLVTTATDDQGLVATCSRRVTAADLTPPSLACPPPATLECSAPGGVPAADPGVAAWLAAAAASDNCTAAPAVGNDAPALFPAGCHPGRTTTVTFAATDGAGLAASCRADLAVADTEPPDLAGCALAPWDLALGGPRPPAPPGSPASTAPSHAAFRIDCGPAADRCASEPVGVGATVVAERSEVVAGACLPVEEAVAVSCGEAVELRLDPPPCPARKPRPARPALSVTSAGVKVIRGERLTVQVRAVDACGNASPPCAVDPARTADPGRPGLALLEPPADPKCPVSPCRR